LLCLHTILSSSTLHLPLPFLLYLLHIINFLFLSVLTHTIVPLGRGRVKTSLGLIQQEPLQTFWGTGTSTDLPGIKHWSFSPYLIIVFKPYHKFM
jgi:hypothetical protein